MAWELGRHADSGACFAVGCRRPGLGRRGQCELGARPRGSAQNRWNRVVLGYEQVGQFRKNAQRRCSFCSSLVESKRENTGFQRAFRISVAAERKAPEVDIHTVLATLGPSAPGSLQPSLLVTGGTLQAARRAAVKSFMP